MKRNIQMFLNKLCPNLYNMFVFRVKNGYFCNLSNPKTFNEKVQWRKKYQHDSRYPMLVDKWEVRKYISQVEPEILVPTYGVYSKIEDIKFEDLPDRFIMKPTHGFGKVVICTDKKKLVKEELIKTAQKWFSYNQYTITGEWQYKDLKPRIIVDSLLGENIKDYKFFCFDGEPYAIQVDSDRYTSHKRQLLDTDWVKLPCSLAYPDDKSVLEKPDELAKMLDISRKLSKGFDFVRVDLFLVDGRIYFSELTFTPGNGMDRFTPYSMDIQFGNQWKVDKKF